MELKKKLLRIMLAQRIWSKGDFGTAVGPGPMDTSFFYGQESPEAVAYHKSASDLGGLTKIEDIAPLIEFPVTDGWWITVQTIFANGGYTNQVKLTIGFLPPNKQLGKYKKTKQSCSSCYCQLIV